MIKNYFSAGHFVKTAFRNMVRNKNFTIINIAGLAAGIAVCLVIFVVIQFHISFENFHTKKDRIYRILTEYHHSDAPEIFYGRGVPMGMPAGLRTTFPQIEKIAPLYSEGNDQILVPDENGTTIKKFKEEKGVYFTQPSFFDIFDFRFLSGDPGTALKDPNTAVVSKETAEKYFPQDAAHGEWQNVIGKTIKWNNAITLKITGVLASIPRNTDFQVKILIAYGTGYTADFLKSTEWDNTGSSFNCYILLPKNESATAFNTQLRAFVKKMKSERNKDSHIIQPLTQIHYDEQAGTLSGKSISHELIRALWLIAIFILLIACINFINLSTAQAVNRAKEVGVRKVLGSNKRQLKFQFLTETFLIVVSAVVLSISISWGAIPYIGKILDLPLERSILLRTIILVFLPAITIAVTLLAGFYPSIVLSRFNPIAVLKSKLVARSTKGFTLRKGLVVFQFVIAQALIIGTLIIVMQMDDFRNRPLGFEKESIANIPFPGDSAGISKLDFLKKQLEGINGIQRVSFSSNTPVEDDQDNWSNFRFDHAIKETEFYTIIKWADHEYVPTYKLPLVAGRNLEASDTAREFLVNEMLIQNLGIKNPNEALNKEISLWNGRVKGNIVGVIKDYHSRSFRRDLAPVLITTRKTGYSSAGIKLSMKNLSTTMGSIEKIWGQTFPDFVFEYQFLDSKIDNFYKEENQLSELYKIFAGIAIFLSCLGLYGLASFMAVQRIKEVGIRKVLGATAANITYLFSKEFIILIGIAFVISSPIAWYFMHKWLENFPYRITISWWMFAVGGIVSIIIALGTVSFQAVKAALTNPVKSLRTE